MLCKFAQHFLCLSLSVQVPGRAGSNHNGSECYELCLQCSVTCGSGEQTREVTCVGAGGVKLEETFCSSLSRPVNVQSCQMSACARRISWHVGEWGLVRAASITPMVQRRRRALRAPDLRELMCFFPVLSELRHGLSGSAGDLLGCRPEPVPCGPMQRPPQTPHGGALQHPALPQTTG